MRALKNFIMNWKYASLLQEHKLFKPKTKIKITFIKSKLYEPIHFFIKKTIKALSGVPSIMFFIVFLIFIFLSFLTVNKLRYSYWSENVVNACPSLVTAKFSPDGKLIERSPIDQIMAPFISRTNGNFFNMFGVLVSLFLIYIWRDINVRKPQMWS